MSTQYLKTPQGGIAYDETGAGPLVICVPSMGDLRGEYRFLAPQLVAAGYRVATMDVRGHGESSTGWADYSVAAIGADMLALVKTLNAGPAILIGTSMAAGAAAWAAVEAPERVSAIVMIGPAVRGVLTPTQKILFGLLFSRPWGRPVWMKFFATRFTEHKPADFAEYSAKLRRNLTEPGRLHDLKQMILAPKTASEQRLDRVSVPALVVMGSKDPDFPNPQEEANWVAARTQARLEMVPGAGHYPHVEMPQEVGKIILGFLQAIQQKEATHVA